MSVVKVTEKSSSSSRALRERSTPSSDRIRGDPRLVANPSTRSSQSSAGLNQSSTSFNTPSKTESRHKYINTGPTATEESDPVEDDEEEADESEIFAKNLNAILLQYLESCGLVDSYTTFYDECKASGMLIPSNFSAEIDRGISLQDVETLLLHFDQENGDALLELWEVLISMVNLGQHSQEVEKITFYIQVYIALIPFRQKMSEERKTSSMKKLRDYFQSKSEACTMDKEMLSLFALPFVPDPETHPVFGNLLKVVWIKKLRCRIKNLARALCSPNKLTTRDDTDLAKMFRTCAASVPHEIESADGEKVCILSNVQPFQFTSGVEVATQSGQSRNDFSPTQLFQRMNDLILENERFKAEESKYEKQCSQLLNVSILLAQSLEEASQGKEVNMDKLRHEIGQCLPMSLLKEDTKQSQEQSSRVDSSSDSDASNTLLDYEDSEVPKKGSQMQLGRSKNNPVKKP